MQHIHRILAIIMMGISASSVYGALKTSIVEFQGVPGNSIESSDGIIWTITTDAASVDYDETLGVCYRSASYVRFSATGFTGKIHRLKINASNRGNNNAYITVYASNTRKKPTLSETPQDYEFYLYHELSDAFVFQFGQKQQQLYSIKYIEVIYDEGATPTSSTKYEQVTNIHQLKNNDEIIIAAQNNNKYRALWGNDVGDFFGYTELTLNDDNTFSSDSNDKTFLSCPILLETVEDENNYWYLRASQGYIYNSSELNTYTNKIDKKVSIFYVHEAVDDNAKVNISFDDEGKATIQFPCHIASDYKSLFFDGSKYICNSTATPLYIFRKVNQEPSTISVTFKEKFGGWTSLYYKDMNLVVPNDFTAYAYSVFNGEGSTSTPYETGDVIPKDTPVLLKLKEEYAEYDEDKTKTVTVAITNEEGEAADENALLGSEDGGTTTVDGITEGYEFFHLTLNAKSEEGSIGFYWGADNGGPFTIGAHQAYLALPKPLPSPTSYIPLRILPYLLGDANGDGQVNVADIMVVVNYIMGNKPSIIKMKRSDVNFDQNINVTDAMGIVKIILNGGRKR